MPFDFNTLIAFLGFAFVAGVSPGPNNLMIMASGASFGWKRTIPHLMGIMTGFTIMVGAVAAGFGAILTAFPIILTFLKIFGVAWLLWLAWQLAQPAIRRTGSAVPDQDHGGTATDRPMSFVEAAMFQWVNPKAWTMAVAATGAYSGITEDAVLRVMLMAGLFAFVSPVCNGVWLFAGQLASPMFTKDRGNKVSSIVMSVLVLASAALIAFG